MPAFFAGILFDTNKILYIIIGMLLFSFAASSIYIVNDYRDRFKDAQHPTKRFRPLAAGTVSSSFAFLLCIVLISISLIGSYFIDPNLFYFILFYYLLNLSYSFGLKNISILDVIIIAIGFILRIQAGAILANVPISVWLNLMVFLLALFIALGKRRDDVLLQYNSGIEMRKSLGGYNIEFLNVTITFLCAIIIVCYLMYTVDERVDARFSSNKLYFTSLFVLIGIFRYLQLIYVKNDTGSPTKIIYKDRFLQITILLWIVSFYVLIYLKHIIA